jgi:Mrp family chromosome partitioning ATPase
MGELAGHCLEPIVDRLIVGSAKGRKVVGFEGCRRGDGCTTVLLAVARRLAERGLRVVMVDADLDHPRLARRLGLAPETGWEAVLAGRLPPAETAVESVEDRLAILPLGEPPAGKHHAIDHHPDPKATMDLLRGAYDLILVDLGRPSKRRSVDLGLSGSAPRWLDAVMLVQNVRGTPESEIAESCGRLHAAGIAEVALVENFV